MHDHWPHGRRHWWAPECGPLRRKPEGALAGGVAAGVAARTGFDVGAVRVAFVITSLAFGFGAAAYVLAWLLLPAEGENTTIASRAMSDRRGITLASGLASLLITLFVIASLLGAGWLSSAAWQIVISGTGLVLVLRNATAGEQAAVRRLAEPLASVAEGARRSPTLARLAVAGVLLVGGLALLLSGHQRLSLLRPLGGTALVVAGIVLVFGPWWLRILRDLGVERQARARAEERADMAARVHDSVLQTLAMIQRRADDPQRVIQLARAQERELRSWLFDGRAPGSVDDGETFAAGIRAIQQEVEAQYGIAVEAVTVGDCEVDDDLAALLAAAREATVNAGKWSGAQVVSVFAEVEAAAVSVFVRDRGKGFDPADVPRDRKGLAESVHARMTRRGGAVTVHSVQGEGTEVSLTMPRAAGERQPSKL
ncbi:MAG TPA: PspC domain-containing protein [Streptosporangiaceae bacterium]|nr:PspC domain-containing protein [Streptosporangiaceae bacterium]